MFYKAETREMILVPRVLAQCAGLLRAHELLAVAIPCSGTFITVDADNAPLVEQLGARARALFDAADGDRISPFPILVTPRGLARGLVLPPALDRKPWYRFWSRA